MRALLLAVLAVLAASLGGAPASAMIATSVLRDVIREAAPRYRQCIDRPLPGPATLTLSFTIAADGHVTEATVLRDEIGRPALTECVLLVTLRLRFPENERGGVVRVNYPFRFEP